MTNRFLLLVGALAATVSTTFAQGPLTPPGAPAPLFKTLTQVEPRTPVQSLAGDGTARYVISQPGSYYFTDNITTNSPGTVAIAIAADNVTLDLGGFSLISAPGVTTGIELRGNRSQVAIANGHLRGFASFGIRAVNAQNNLRLEQLTLSGTNAPSGIGISINNSTNLVVHGCSVSDFGSGGITLGVTQGTVEASSVFNCGIFGIRAGVVRGCEVKNISSAFSTGAIGIDGELVADCLVSSVVNTSTGTAYGIDGSTVQNCQVSSVTSGSNFAVGISATTIEGCTAGTVNVTGAGDAYGITGTTIRGCRVGSVNNTSPNAGASQGINGYNVHDCQVATIGGPASFAASVGIQAFNVSGSAVTSVGSTNATAGATGIQGSAGGTIIASTASVINAGTAGSATGISGSVVADCGVSFVTMPPTGIGLSLGISAETISGCRVGNVFTANATNAVGLHNYRLARDCSVTTVTSVGSGQAIGCLTTSAGRTERVNIFGADDVGISVVSGHTVTDCNTTTGNTAILATGTRNVIDGNNIAGSSITGIMVANASTNAHALVIRNQVRNCTTNFTLNLPCQSGPIINAAGAIAAGANPWANFTD